MQEWTPIECLFIQMLDSSLFFIKLSKKRLPKCYSNFKIDIHIILMISSRYKSLKKVTQWRNVAYPSKLSFVIDINRLYCLSISLLSIWYFIFSGLLQSLANTIIKISNDYICVSLNVLWNQIRKNSHFRL